MNTLKNLSRFAAGLAVLMLAANLPAFAEKEKLINGAGSSFVYPAVTKWFAEYAKVNPAVNFNYQSIGSGGGIKQITAQTVDFGASDAYLTNEQLRAMPGKAIQVPVVAGAVVVTYNIPGVTEQLKFKPDVLADIFLGVIKKWNDPRIAETNAGVNLPAADIIVAHRSDGSGTSAIFTDYLSSVSPAWKKKVGKGTSVSWPVGLGGKGNEGVAGTLKQTPNSIGYVELAYAEKNRLPYAQLQNKSGNFVAPTLESTTKAIEGKLNSIPDDFRFSLVNPDGADAYPIAGVTWIILYQKQKDGEKGRALVDFLKWAIHDGQQFTKDLNYAPLPESLAAKITKRLEEVQAGK